ncbi:MAG: hypothetical protein ACSLFB_00705 [Acidimicrobiales bacterium]
MKMNIRRLGPVVLLAGLGVVTSGCAAGITAPSVSDGHLNFTPPEYNGVNVVYGTNGVAINGPTFDPGAVTLDLPVISTGGLWFGNRA